MGRYRTGTTTREAVRIELSYLLKEGFIKKGAITRGVLSWTNGGRISIECKYIEDEQYIRFNYILTNRDRGKKEYDYNIHLTFVPSNLGSGDVPYFVCPDTGDRCRILYRAYGSPIWKSRNAYRYTLFYPTQTSSKLSKYNDEYWSLDKQIKSLRNEIRNQTHYNGKPTRRYKRLQRLRDRQERADHLRWSPQHMPMAVKKLFTDFGIE